MLHIHDEITYNGRKLLICTDDIPGGPGCMTVYETMAMWADNSMDIDCIRTHDEDEARRNHKHIMEKWQGAEDFRRGEETLAKNPPLLSGKYAKLRDDLKRAIAATEYLETTEDGGTFNFDAPTLNLERWNAAKIEQAAKEAGCGAFKWIAGRMMLGWVFSIPGSGNANRRTRRAEAVSKAMKSAGYDAGMYYQMD